MRVITILILLLPLLSFSQINQTDSNGLRQGLWTKQQANGRLIYEGSFKDGEPVGDWKRYHQNGQIKVQINYSEVSDSAQTQIFDVLGKKVAEGVYVNQKKEGNWIYFSGKKIVSEEQFKKDLKHGISKKYYNSGELMEEIDWVNGKQEGSYQIFYKDGKPYMQCKMKQDQRHGLCLIHSSKGKLEMEANYKNNLRHGEWRYYNEKGELKYALKYNEGELLNPEVRDSVANLTMQNIEKNKGKINDPAKFMQDPSEYMRKMNSYR
jgi:antitoxin component YwqK of YwqJK toxin-antitoxin module